MGPSNNKKRENNKIPKGYLDFQPDSVEIEKRPIPIKARLTLYLLTFAIVSGVSWACLAEIDRVVTAKGKLVTKAGPIVIQPLQASIIREIHVEEGQEVKEEQPLVTLDSTFTKADLDATKDQLSSISVQTARLECELENRPFRLLPSFDKREFGMQATLYDTRKREYSANLNRYKKVLSELDANIYTKEAEREQVLKQIEGARELEEMHARLSESGSGARSWYLKQQSERLRFEIAGQNLENVIKEKKHEIARIQSEIDAFISNWYSTTAQNLVENRRERERLSKQLEKSDRLNELVVFKSQKRAVVQEIAKLSIGSVVNTASTIMTLVPLDEEQEAEVEVLARDIGFIRKGDKTRIKIEAFPFQEHGTISGFISAVSEDSFKKESLQGVEIVYKTRIKLSGFSLVAVPADFRLIPGMTLTAEIKVGKRKVISYFLYPVIRYLDETMREP